MNKGFALLNASGNAQSLPTNKPKVFGNGVGTNFVGARYNLASGANVVRAKVLPQRVKGSALAGVRGATAPLAGARKKLDKSCGLWYDI